MLKRVIFSGYLKTQVSALWLVCGVLVNRSSFWSLCSCCPPVKVSSVVFIFNFGNENCKSVSLITEITCYAFLRKWKWKSRGISSSYVEKSSEKFYIKVLPRIRQGKCPWWWDIWIFPINCSQPYLIFWLIANIKIQMHSKFLGWKYLLRETTPESSKVLKSSEKYINVKLFMYSDRRAQNISFMDNASGNAIVKATN